MRYRLGIALASDQWIIAHTNDLTATLWFLAQHAIDKGDEAWLIWLYWWLQAATRLSHCEATPRSTADLLWRLAARIGRASMGKVQ